MNVCFVLVTRIIRVIGQPRGNMLLIGIGGSGRQSLTRLASYIIEYKVFQIEVTKHYRTMEFRDGEHKFSRFSNSTIIRHTLFTASIDNMTVILRTVVKMR